MKPIIDKPITESHKKVMNLLKENGINNTSGGVQLFANQYDTEYSVSINYMGTGLRIPISDIDSEDLIEDEEIRICKDFECKL